MKDFTRRNQLFSLCGLNCGLCPMRLGEYCPGCGGGVGNQPCAIARCSLRHGKVDYCYQCGEFPCDKYEDIDLYDSFITHQNRMQDLEKCRKIGEQSYIEEQTEKIEIFKFLLGSYNDSRRKTFYSLTVNLLELSDLREGLKQIAQREKADMTAKEKAALAVTVFQDIASKRDIVLKLHKKPKEKR